ncbi:MAG: protein kinase domain-containing protein [Myxococcota bacterium]
MSRRCPSCGTSFSGDVSFCGHCGALTIQVQDEADFDARLGQNLGQYMVVARVADGAMGRVYEGRHAETRDRVAIKVLHPEVAQDEVSVERFRREFETAEEFDHPNIVKVLEFGETDDGSYFMTMEYLQGEELGELLRRDGIVPSARMIRLVCQIALALDHAHSHGVIHRDLKPDNVFLVEAPEGDLVRILDFGSVKLQVEMGPKLTAFGTTLGSPYYMSPEQAMGKQDVDRRSDVFALAAIMHEMATGKVAFDGDQVAQILMKIMQHEPPAPSTSNDALPAAFDDVVATGLRKEKTQRYGDASELAQAMLASFGLEGSVEQWASTPVAQIEARLAEATPPARQPYADGQPPPPAPVSAPPAAVEVTEEGDYITHPKASSGVLMGFAFVGVVVVGGALLAAYLLLT